MIKFLLICIATTIVTDAFEFLPVLEDEDIDVRITRKPARLGHEHDDIQPSTNRNGLKRQDLLWPGGVVPYAFATQYGPNSLSIINGAIKAIQDNTCIKFVPRTNQANYISIAAHPNGETCSSHIGTQNRGQQVVYLSYGAQTSCIHHRVVVHELMHTIGLDHEHNRYDRDQYVRVNTANAIPDQAFNFNKVNPNDFFDYGCPYTYESAMHYEKSAFARPRTAITMNPTNQAYLNIIGKLLTVHANDYEKINRIYKCNKVASGHTCGPKPATATAKPAVPTCTDDPSAPCAQVAQAGCDSSAWATYWKPKCGKSCKTCRT